MVDAGLRNLNEVIPDISKISDLFEELEHISQEVEDLIGSSREQSLVAVDASDVTISFNNTSAIGWQLR
ncbi:MAG: hypothetical protein WBZ42_02910 [Halobacteriota archaeon]